MLDRLLHHGPYAQVRPPETGAPGPLRLRKRDSGKYRSKAEIGLPPYLDLEI